jgi:hypothetical protein
VCAHDFVCGVVRHHECDSCCVWVISCQIAFVWLLGFLWVLTVEIRAQTVTCPAGKYIPANTGGVNVNCIACPTSYTCPGVTNEYVNIGTGSSPSVSKALADSYFSRTPDGSGIFYRACPSCVSTHQHIWYRRLTPIGTFSMYSNAFQTWASAQNVLNVDFALYSSLNDLLADTNRWQFCNYDDGNIGFPRDCGPSGSVGGQWNQLNNGGNPSTYYILLITNEGRVFDCPAGSFCPSGATVSSPCPKGSFSGQSNQPSCQTCPSGSYCPSMGMTAPVTCPAGNYCPVAGLSVFTACTSGRFQSNAGASSCDSICDSGSFATVGASTCTVCAPGSYQPTSGASVCLSTPAGSFSAGTANTGFAACAAGAFSLGSAGTMCVCLSVCLSVCVCVCRVVVWAALAC